jgi:hypothetical protein
MALEPTCLALLALRQDQRTNAQSFLGAQRPDGSWPAFVSDDGPSGLTGLALLTLNSLGTFPEAANRAAHWLLQTRGREASLLWKWKFLTTDTRVRFNPDKFGWPWQPGTCSWVVPTAFGVLALKQSFPCCRRGQIAYRIQRGVKMLLDRACPSGGWNAGSGVVYGTPMQPHLDATAIALLALRGEPRQELIERGLASARVLFQLGSVEPRLVHPGLRRLRRTRRRIVRTSGDLGGTRCDRGPRNAGGRCSRA